MKCSIDNKAPRQATHLKTKAKKNALMEDRIDQIETENRILLEKMSHIMRVSWSAHSLFCGFWESIKTNQTHSFSHKGSTLYYVYYVRSSLLISSKVQGGNKLQKRKHTIRPFPQQGSSKERTPKNHQTESQNPETNPGSQADVQSSFVGG